jgi:hypothetical protein
MSGCGRCPLGHRPRPLRGRSGCWNANLLGPATSWMRFGLALDSHSADLQGFFAGVVGRSPVKMRTDYRRLAGVRPPKRRFGGKHPCAVLDGSPPAWRVRAGPSRRFPYIATALSFADATSGVETFGGGRYLLDSVKGADLGKVGDKLVLEFNLAYSPSCACDSRWICPLATPANRLPVEIRAGRADLTWRACPELAYDRPGSVGKR